MKLDEIMAQYTHFTPAQRRAVEMAANTNANLSLRSTAGSGKSTVIKAMAQVIDPNLRTVALAFNNTIEKELRTKLPPHVETRTSHGFCKDALSAVYGPLGAPNQFKRNNLVQAYLKEKGVHATKEQLRDAVALCHLALLTMTPPEAEALAKMSQKFAYTLPPKLDLVDLVRTVTTRSKESFLSRKEYDFTDLLYLVPALNVLPGTVDVMLVDESQDFSALQRKIVEHFLGYRGNGKKGRLVAVGDPEQAIYEFTGADSDSMSRMEDLFQSEILALDLTFRCPKSHVRYARLFSDVIQAPDTAIEGEVKLIPESELAQHIQGGELIMSRNRAPLVSFALNLLAQGKSANLVGGEIQGEIEKHIKAALTVPFTPAEVGTRLQERARELLSGYRQRGMKSSEIGKAVQKDADILGCCAALATRAALNAPEGVGTLSDIQTLLSQIGNAEAGATQLCTIHKAKGLEADVSIILRPEDLKTEGEEGQAERCVNFVAMTRGKKVLIFAPQSSEYQLPILPEQSEMEHETPVLEALSA